MDLLHRADGLLMRGDQIVVFDGYRHFDPLVFVVAQVIESGLGYSLDHDVTSSAGVFNVSIAWLACSSVSSEMRQPNASSTQSSIVSA